jgi:hypothetical protein
MQEQQETVATPTTLEELTEWLEMNEIDHPDYDRHFSTLKRLEEDGEQESD